jgi:hypothetical protein
MPTSRDPRTVSLTSRDPRNRNILVLDVKRKQEKANRNGAGKAEEARLLDSKNDIVIQRPHNNSWRSVIITG